jgi:3-methyladenine DNA glycosylase AlkD
MVGVVNSGARGPADPGARGPADPGARGPADPGAREPADPGAREAAELEQAIRALGSPGWASNSKAYLKIDLEFAGVSVPAIRSAVVTWTGRRGRLPHDQLTAIAAALWESPLFESRLAAEFLLERHARLLLAADIDLAEHLLRNSGTWALVDGIAANVAGEIAERYPEPTGGTLDRWAGDADFWIRRSAMLALLRPLRRGGGDFDRFARYADAMLEEKEFFIRKAIGWVLRDTAKRRPELVAAWLAPRVQRASGVTVREAVKPLSPQARDRLLAGYREKRPVHWP